MWGNLPIGVHRTYRIVALELYSRCRYLLLGTHQVSLRSFEGAMIFLGEKDIDSDEVQCIVANLIEKVGDQIPACVAHLIL